MADGRLEVFRRVLLDRGFFAHVAPLRLRPGVASVIWESLVSMRHCSREHFADNRSAQYLFIYIDIDYTIYMHALLGSLYRPSGMGPGAFVLEPSPHPPQQPAVYSACMVAIIRHVYSFCPFRTSSIVVLASESDVLL